MANIQIRTTTDNRIMYTARVRIKGCPHQTATFARKTDAKKPPPPPSKIPTFL